MLSRSEVPDSQEVGQSCCRHHHQAVLSVSMLYEWVKTGVGTLLTANFAVPLCTVVSNRHLWEEPMAVLAGNMSLTCTLVGITAVLIGIYDLAHFQSITLCRFLMYTSFGVGLAFKMAQVCAAVDQVVAVVHPLRHYSIMMRARAWLFAATWITCAAQLAFGFVAHLLDMQTFSENVVTQGNYTAFTGCRWETTLADVYTVIVEVEMVTFSLITASLLVYTGVIGYRLKVRLVRRERQLQNNGVNSGDDNQTFFENYRAFKKILMVLSLTVTMDIVAPILRISSRWHPRPKLNGLLHQLRLFGFIFEGWAYGLLNTKLRAAYRKTFCGKSRRVENFDGERYPPPQACTTASPATTAAASSLELRSVEDEEAKGSRPLELSPIQLQRELSLAEAWSTAT